MRVGEEEIVLKHPNSEGVLCWGGPRHGFVVPIDDSVHQGAMWKFPMMRKPSLMKYEHQDDSTDLYISTVAYRMQLWHYLWRPDFGEIWPVLFYKENYEQLLKNFERTCNFVLWLANPRGLSQDLHRL